MAMTTRELIETIYRTTLSGNMDALSAYLDPDFQLYEPESLPYRGTYRGLEGYKELFGKFAQAWGAGLSVTVGEMIVEGNKAAARLIVTGSKKSGKKVTMPIIEIWEVRNGRAVSVHPFYWDTAVVNALGN